MTDPADPPDAPVEPRCDTPRDAPVDASIDAPIDAQETSVAPFSESALSKPSSKRVMRPSKRWALRKQRVVWPLVGVSVLSSLAVAVLYSQRVVGAPLGLAFVLAMPFVISALLGLLMRRRSKGKTVGIVALVYLCTVITTVFAGGEGAICVAMSSPILIGLTLTTTLLTQSYVRSRLSKADKQHRALLIVLIVLVLPYLAPRIDALMHRDSSERTTLASSISVPASQEEVWRSLQQLDVTFAPPTLGTVEAMLPVPVSITGEGARLGAERRVQFKNGAVIATVTHLEPPHRYHIDLQVVDAGIEFFDHWIALESSRFDIRAVSERECVVVHSTTYRPLMHPRFAFEPIERALGALIQQRLLDVYAQQVLARMPRARVALAAERLTVERLTVERLTAER